MPVNEPAQNAAAEYVTVTIGGQLFGIPIACVQDVFVITQMTRVPLAPADVAGVVNLRGRIVTAIDMHSRLGLTRQASAAPLAVGIASANESYCLLIDAVGEVIALQPDTAEPVPTNLDEGLKRIATVVHRLRSELLVVLDVDRVLALKPETLAA